MPTVKDIMTRDVFVLYEHQSLDLARSLMTVEHVRHVPIVNAAGGFVGLITHRDFLAPPVSLLAGIDKEAQADLDRHIPIRRVMKTGVLTAAPDLDLCTAIVMLLQNKYGCLPVVADHKLVGIVTEADFLELTLELLRCREEETDRREN
jgi:CBS domain-containing membrane protein